MCTINSATDYIITSFKCEGEEYLPNIKLQKLLYYSQAWHLGIYKNTLFDGKFQAWIHGPVNREIYDRFCARKDLYSDIEMDDRIECNPNVTEEEKEFFDFILENYGGYSGVQLEIMTHSEKPWIEARGTCGKYDRCNTIISEDTMKTYYGELWNKNDNK